MDKIDLCPGVSGRKPGVPRRWIARSCDESVTLTILMMKLSYQSSMDQLHIGLSPSQSKSIISLSQPQFFCIRFLPSVHLFSSTRATHECHVTAKLSSHKSNHAKITAQTQLHPPPTLSSTPPACCPPWIPRLLQSTPRSPKSSAALVRHSCNSLDSADISAFRASRVAYCLIFFFNSRLPRRCHAGPRRVHG